MIICAAGSTDAKKKCSPIDCHPIDCNSPTIFFHFCTWLTLIVLRSSSKPLFALLRFFGHLCTSLHFFALFLHLFASIDQHMLTNRWAATHDCHPYRYRSGGNRSIALIGRQSIGWQSIGWQSIGWQSIGWQSIGWQSIGWVEIDRAAIDRQGRGSIPQPFFALFALFLHFFALLCTYLFLHLFCTFLPPDPSDRLITHSNHSAATHDCHPHRSGGSRSHDCHPHRSGGSRSGGNRAAIGRVGRQSTRPLAWQSCRLPNVAMTPIVCLVDDPLVAVLHQEERKFI
jgi:hypothetical protein